MQFFINGGRRIFGKILCNGAKNFANKAILATLLSEEESCLENIPNIGEIDMVLNMITSIGASIRKINNFLFINPQVTNNMLHYPDNRTNRMPILFLGILIHRFNNVFVPHSGGDKIGLRNIDFHIDIFKQFGCKFNITDRGYNILRDDKLNPANIILPYPSVGATENALFLSVLTQGQSTISNISIEPETISLIEMLNKMGADIKFMSERNIVINGVDKLHGVKFTIMGDRLEAASWACLASSTKGEIEVIGCDKSYLLPFIEKFEEAGGICHILQNDRLIFSRKDCLKGISVTTDVFPGFSTDWQPLISIMLSQASGKSYIHDTVYENRLGYLKALQKLGLKSQVKQCQDEKCRYYHEYDSAIIEYSELVSRYTFLSPPDIRAGLAYLIASLTASGVTILNNIEYLDRGYGDIIKKLEETNADIKFFSNDLHVYQPQMKYE